VRVRILCRAHGQAAGVSLDRFEPGFDIGTTIANLLLAEGWAEPVDGTAAAAATNSVNGLRI